MFFMEEKFENVDLPGFDISFLMMICHTSKPRLLACDMTTPNNHVGQQTCDCSRLVTASNDQPAVPLTSTTTNRERFANLLFYVLFIY